MFFTDSVHKGKAGWLGNSSIDGWQAKLLLLRPKRIVHENMTKLYSA
jgi:hypothetical protein